MQVLRVILTPYITTLVIGDYKSLLFPKILS